MQRPTAQPSFGEVVWTPTPERVRAANLTAFIAAVNARRGLALSGYDDLYRWSVDDAAAFWSSWWDAAGVIAPTKGTSAKYLAALAKSGARPRETHVLGALRAVLALHRLATPVGGLRLRLP
ncbi:MAG: hypothetical protein R6T93_01705 [Trueperaceae bacterium]